MTALRNFLFLNIITVTEVGYWLLAGVWLAMILLTCWSISSKSIGLAQKFFWFAAIISLPVVGLFAYLCACLISADWEIFKQMGFFSGSKKKIANSIRPVK